MKKPLKLKTQIIHSFDIESDLMDDLEFNVDIPVKNIKVKTKIIEVKKKKLKNDSSTRLF